MSESRRFIFDEESVDALEAGDREWRAWDEELEGFGVRVRPSGTKSWIVNSRTTGQDGKPRNRRITIGRHGEMTIEEARRKARELLADGASEEEPDGRREEATSKSGAGPDREADPPRNDAGMEGAPGAAVGSGAVAMSVTTDGEEFDPETGEIVVPASGVDEPESHDDDLDFENSGMAVETGQESEGDGEAVGPDHGLVEDVVGDTIDRVRDSPGQDASDPEPPASEVPVRPSESGEGRSAIRRGGDGEESASDDRRQSRDVSGVRKPEAREEGDRQPESGGSPDTEEAKAERPKRSRVANMTKEAVHTVGKAAGKVAGIARKGTAETSAGAGKPAGEPEAARSADGLAEEKADQEGVAEAAARAGRKTEDAEASGEKTRAASDVSDETAAAFAQNLDRMREQLDRVDIVTGALGPRLDTLATAISVSTKDFRQRKRRRVRTVLAAAVLALVFFAGGAAVENRLPFLPLPDPTLGWKDHIWKHYGDAFRECFQRARQAESGYVDCTIKVRGR